MRGRRDLGQAARRSVTAAGRIEALAALATIGVAHRPPAPPGGPQQLALDRRRTPAASTAWWPSAARRRSAPHAGRQHRLVALSSSPAISAARRPPAPPGGPQQLAGDQRRTPAASTAWGAALSSSPAIDAAHRAPAPPGRPHQLAGDRRRAPGASTAWAPAPARRRSTPRTGRRRHLVARTSSPAIDAVHPPQHGLVARTGRQQRLVALSSSPTARLRQAAGPPMNRAVHAAGCCSRRRRQPLPAAAARCPCQAVRLRKRAPAGWAAACPQAATAAPMPWTTAPPPRRPPRSPAPANVRSPHGNARAVGPVAARRRNEGMRRSGQRSPASGHGSAVQHRETRASDAADLRALQPADVARMPIRRNPGANSPKPRPPTQKSKTLIPEARP